MHHIAIMRKDWKLIPKILSGEKTIESRWYKTKRTPWDKIKRGDTVYFKNSGEPITAQSNVLKVLQFTISSIADAQQIVKKYGKQICIVNSNPKSWERLPKYCILIFIGRAKPTKPIYINKFGFGVAAAWISIPKIQMIKLDKLQ